MHMTNEKQNKISLRFLKEKGLYQRWKYNVIKQNTLYNKLWLANNFVNKDFAYNIIQYGFNWGCTKEKYVFWEKKQKNL